MALRYYSNAPATTLASSCTALATTVTVASATGLPVQYPYVLIFDRGTASEEVVLVTAGTGTSLTVTRGYDSTTAFAHAEDATVEHGISAIDAREANAHVNSTGAVHGIAGEVVGDADTQTLTNKDLSSATNTFPSTLATDDEVAAAQSAAEATAAAYTDALVPAGCLTMFAGTSVPSGWLLCDGSQVDRASYADLFAAIGTAYGAGDGVNSFNLPDLLSTFPRGGSTVNDVGTTGGEATTTLAEGNLPAHTHSAGTLGTSTDGSHSHNLQYTGTDTGLGASVVRSSTPDGEFSTATIANGDHNHDVTGSTGSTGSGTSFSNEPPYLTLNFIIKT